jgi:hypothetical protein
MAGHAEGVAKGQVVLSGEGLVGRVMQVGIHSSRVLLITDINSRLPVLVGESGTRAIMAGNNGGRPRLLYLGAKSGVAPGDKVVTSGDADAFPVGLPIGTVARVQDGVVEVEPHMSGDRLLYVRIFDFGLGNSAADTAPTAPTLAAEPIAATPPAPAAPAPQTAARPVAPPTAAAPAPVKPTPVKPTLAKPILAKPPQTKSPPAKPAVPAPHASAPAPAAPHVQAPRVSAPAAPAAEEIGD